MKKSSSILVVTTIVLLQTVAAMEPGQHQKVAATILPRQGLDLVQLQQKIKTILDKAQFAPLAVHDIQQYLSAATPLGENNENQNPYAKEIAHGLTQKFGISDLVALRLMGNTTAYQLYKQKRQQKFLNSKTYCGYLPKDMMRAVLLPYLAGADDMVSSLTRAAENSDTKLLEQLTALGVDINSRDRCGFTPLIRAVEKGHGRAVQLLINAGADVNIPAAGFSPLRVAAINGHILIALLLINAGADVNSKTDHGFFPLMDAAFNGYAQLVALLIDAGADVNMQNEFGVTALGLVQDRQQPEIVRLLKRAELKKAVLPCVLF